MQQGHPNGSQVSSFSPQIVSQPCADMGATEGPPEGGCASRGAAGGAGAARRRCWASAKLPRANRDMTSVRTPNLPPGAPRRKCAFRVEHVLHKRRAVASCTGQAQAPLRIDADAAAGLLGPPQT